MILFIVEKVIMGIVVPTLSIEGWLSDARLQASYLMKYFLVSDYSQSNDYQGQVKSLPYYIQRGSGNFFYLQEDIQNALKELFGRHFDDAEVGVKIVTSDDLPEIDKSRFNIDITVIVTKAGTRFSLGRLLQIINEDISLVKET